MKREYYQMKLHNKKLFIKKNSELKINKLF